MAMMLLLCKLPKHLYQTTDVLHLFMDPKSQDPQVVTGSHDTTIKLWDLAAGLQPVLLVTRLLGFEIFISNLFLVVLDSHFVKVES